MMPRTHRPRAGFTLVELIVTAVIVAFIAAATTAALSQAVRARDGAGARSSALARAAGAADRIAQDVQAAVRDPDPLHVRVVVYDGASAAGEADSLLLFARTERRVRPARVPGTNDPPEGPSIEAHYRLEPDPTRPGTSVLWRRADPVPDDVPDGGGVAEPVVSGIISLSIQAADEAQWYDQWDSDYSGYPHAVRVTVVAADDRSRSTATARRTVALDRTPLPAASDTSDAAASTPTGATTGSGGATGTTGGGGGGSGGPRGGGR